MSTVFAPKSFQNIVIKSRDTDVFILTVARSFQINAKLFFNTGSFSAFRIIDVTAFAHRLSESASQALTGVHTFTGC